jgi:hypothetical protein
LLNQNSEIPAQATNTKPTNATERNGGSVHSNQPPWRSHPSASPSNPRGVAQRAHASKQASARTVARTDPSIFCTGGPARASPTKSIHLFHHTTTPRGLESRKKEIFHWPKKYSAAGRDLRRSRLRSPPPHLSSATTPPSRGRAPDSGEEAPHAAAAAVPRLCGSAPSPIGGPGPALASTPPHGGRRARVGDRDGRRRGGGGGRARRPEEHLLRLRFQEEAPARRERPRP